MYRTPFLLSFIVECCLELGRLLVILRIVGSNILDVVAVPVVPVDQFLKSLLSIPVRTSRAFFLDYDVTCPLIGEQIVNCVNVFLRPIVVRNGLVEEILSTRDGRSFG